jgi:hypothetical protein
MLTATCHGRRCRTPLNSPAENSKGRSLWWMASFHVVVRRELIADDREILESQGYEVVWEFGPAQTSGGEAPIPREAREELENSTGYIARVPAQDESDALGRVGSALGIDDATIWRAYPAGALP